MPYKASDYRQFAHDTLNMIGRLQSVAELADIQDDELRTLFDKDIENLTRAVKLFSKIGWSLHDCEDPTPKPIDVSALLFEVVSANRPEGMLLAIDENVRTNGCPSAMRVMIEEIIHNVVVHGDLEQPSKVMLRRGTKGYVLEVENVALEPLPEDVDQLFVKGNRSRGLGLGVPMLYAVSKKAGIVFELTELENGKVRACLQF